MSRSIRVLVVDDSALMRKCLGDMINADHACEVIATARDGKEALRSVAVLRPDVVTLDIDLPKINGVEVLKYIMSEWPTPVIVITGYSTYDGQEIVRCLEFGAVDILVKQNGAHSAETNLFKHELLTKIKMAARANLKLLRPLLVGTRSIDKERRTHAASKVVAIASSSGGPRALTEVVPHLAPDLGAGVMVAQHMPCGYTRSLADRLNAESRLRVVEAEDGGLVREGETYLGPGGYIFSVEVAGTDEKRIKLTKGRKGQGPYPSADTMMKTIAPIYGKDVLGVVLTGMGSDGTEGLRAIKRFGGRTIAEDESSCIVYGMPKSAVRAGVADNVVSLGNIAGEINRWAQT